MEGGAGVAKREWGAKHICAECGVKFYDLHRRPITCPKCDSVIEIETVRPSRRRPPAAPPERAPAAKVEAVVAVETVDAVKEADDDDGDDVIDDDDTLADDVGVAASTQAAK